jgi:hypothetical protein
MTLHLAALVLHAVLFGLTAYVVTTQLRRLAGLPPAAALAVTGVVVAIAGYGAFWLWLWSVSAGKIFVVCWWTLVAILAFRHRGQLRRVAATPDVVFPVLLILGSACLQFGALHLYRTPFGIDELAANRFVAGLPLDNEIPRFFAERLLRGLSPRALIGDWLSSDRPPLQTGVILLTAPLASQIKLPLPEAAHAAAWFCQALWIPALWLLLRSARISPSMTTSLIAVIAFSGLVLLHGLYVWPKLMATAFVILAWYSCVMPTPSSIHSFATAGLCAALAWLAHGGAAFPLLALASIVAVLRRPQPFVVLAAIGGFLLLALPWIAYQKFYEPPGNRLLKWHLAGVIPPDDRGFVETLIDAYSKLTPGKIVENKRANFSRLGINYPGHWVAFTTSGAESRRAPYFFDLLHSLMPWLLAWLLLPWCLYRHPAIGRFAGSLLLWITLTVIGWGLLMFGPGTTHIHQGSLVVPLLGSAASGILAWTTHRLVFLLLAGWQVGQFIATWLPPSHRTGGPLSMGALLLLLVGAAALGCSVAAAFRVNDQASPSPNPEYAP